MPEPTTNQPLTYTTPVGTPPPKQSNFWLMFGVIGGGIVVLLIAVYYLFWQTPAPAPETGSPTGIINLSLVPVGQEGPSSIVKLYAYDFATGQLVARDSHISLGHTFQGITSPDGTKMVHISRPPAGSREELLASYPQVYVSNIMADGSLDGGHPLTSSEGVKRNPAWSPDGTRVAYNVEPPPGGDRAPNQWMTYVVDQNGVEVPITEGLYPAWSPDGTKLMVLKDDGVWVVGVDEVDERRIVRMGGEGEVAHVNMQFDVSPDGTTLAFPNATDDRITLFSIDSWDEARATYVETIQVAAFWPRFSPDGRYIAMEILDAGSTARPRTITGQRLAIYDRETKEITTLLDLNSYDQNSLWIDEWAEGSAPVHTVSSSAGVFTSVAHASHFEPLDISDCPGPWDDTGFFGYEDINGVPTEVHVYECANGNWMIGNPSCSNYMGVYPPYEEPQPEDDPEPEPEAEEMEPRLRVGLQGQACNQSSITVPAGTAVNLCWQDNNGVAETCDVNRPTPPLGFSTGGQASGSDLTDPLTADTQFRVRCRDWQDNQANSNFVQVTVTQAAGTPTLTLGANPATIQSGGSSTLTWTTSNVTSCTTTSSPSNGQWNSANKTPLNGSQNITNLTQSTTFTMNCTGPGGSIQKSAVVTVGTSGFSCTLTANPATIAPGQTSRVYWTGQGHLLGATASISPNIGSVPYPSPNDNSAPTPVLNQSTTYTMTVTNPGSNAPGGGQSTQCQATVNVSATPPPTVTLNANPTSVTSGGGSTLTWSSQNATSCTASASPSNGQWTGSKNLSGSQGITNLTQTTAFTITCSGNGSTQASRTVTVTPPAGGEEGGGGGGETPPPNITLSVDRDRVQEGTSVTFSYNTGGRTCTITSPFHLSGFQVTGQSTFTHAMTGLGDATFTLGSCTTPLPTPPSVSVTVRVLPEFQEI